MENKLETIITNTLSIEKVNIKKDKIKNIIDKFYLSIINNKEYFIKLNNIDIKNNNGFKLDFNVINKIFKNFENDLNNYNDTIFSYKNNDYVYGKYLSPKGTVLLITEGNTYILIELILKNLLANNTLIINTNGYMYSVNNLLIEILSTILKNISYSENQIQLYVSESSKEVLNHFTSIDLVICIGNHNLQMFVQNNCKNELIISGYNNFDIYLDTNKYMDLVNNIINQNVNINFYVNKDLNIDIENSIIVNDIEEAIAQINFNGSKYSSTIFTENMDSAKYFIKNVKSKIQTINISPTVERSCDIKDLMIEKTIIFPIKNNIKFDINDI